MSTNTRIFLKFASFSSLCTGNTSEIKLALHHIPIAFHTLRRLQVMWQWEKEGDLRVSDRAIPECRAAALRPVEGQVQRI